MIEKMTKLTLVVHHAARADLVSQLQELGVYHVSQAVPAVSDRILELRDHIALLEKYHQLLTQYQTVYEVNLPQDTLKGDIHNLVDEIDEIKLDMDNAKNQLDALRKQAGILRHYGNFDPAIIDSLEKAKLKVAFCSCARSKFLKLDTGGLALEILSESRGGISYVVFYHRGDKLTPAQMEVLANQETIPEKSLHSVTAEIEKLEDELDSMGKALIDRTKYLDAIRNEILVDQNRLAYELAHTGMVSEAEGAVYVMTGFVPVAKQAAVETFLKSQELVFFAEAPSHHDQVPVKLKQNPFALLFQPIMRLNSLPNYWELDTTPYFAPFYVLFFGLCIADAGYGILMLLVTLIAYARIKNPDTRKLIVLGIILSLSCIVGGIMLDDYFGVRPVIEYEKELALFQAAAAGTMEMPHSPGILVNLAILRNQGDAMLFPLMLGVLQVMFGWVLRIRNQVRHFGWQGFGQPTGNILIMLGLVQWLLPMIMLRFFRTDPNTFHIGPFQIHYLFTAIPSLVGQIMLFTGFGLVLLFNGLENRVKIFIRPLAGLWPLYELAQHLIGDTLSYIRLFALGLAGGLLAEAFNNIAMNMVKGHSTPLMFVPMVIVLLFGHSINFGIGLISAFVHSLRLQFVEFYNAVEFKGGGVEYEPLHSSQPIASTLSVKKQIEL